MKKQINGNEDENKASKSNLASSCSAIENLVHKSQIYP